MSNQFYTQSGPSEISEETKGILTALSAFDHTWAKVTVRFTLLLLLYMCVYE